jgi:hypothetical protein
MEKDNGSLPRASDAPSFEAKHVNCVTKGASIFLTLQLDALEGAPRYLVTPVNPAVVRASDAPNAPQHVPGCGDGEDCDACDAMNAEREHMGDPDKRTGIYAPAAAAHAGAMLTDDEAALLTRIKHFHTHEFGRGPELHSDAIEDAYKKGRAAAPTPTATAPAALTDYRIKRMAADFWKVQNVMGVDSCMFDAVGFAHALLATNPDSTGVSK